MDNLIDKTLESLDKAIVVYDKAEETLRDNWKPLTLGAGIGAVGAAMLWFWVAR